MASNYDGSWKRAIFGIAVLGAASMLGWYFFAQTSADIKDKNVNNNNGDSMIKPKRKKKPINGTKNVYSKNANTDKPDHHVAALEADGIPSESELAVMLKLCDLDATDLLMLSPEQRQKVFYALLMKGEILMQQQGDPIAIEKAIKYFSKAVGLVPNPGEVLGALEQALPPEIYRRLLATIQSNMLERMKRYFEGLSNDHPIQFVPGGRNGREWIPVAREDIFEGSVVFTEKPALLFIPSNSFPESLTKHCDSTGSNMALFMYSYVSMLLKEEMLGNGAAQMGPFAHFDHLPQAVRIPTVDDITEAALIRESLGDQNEPTKTGLAEFLTNDIYAAMKVTLQRVLLDLEKQDEVVYHLGGAKSSKFGLFHLAAHFPHTCAHANVALHLKDVDTIAAVACSNIKKGEALLVSYLKEPSNEFNHSRLLKEFGILCNCGLKESEELSDAGLVK